MPRTVGPARLSAGAPFHYHYGQDSQPIVKNLANGTVLQEYTYLHNGPVVLLEYEPRPYVTNHLGTQQLTDSRETVVWQTFCSTASVPVLDYRPLKSVVRKAQG